MIPPLINKFSFEKKDFMNFILFPFYEFRMSFLSTFLQTTLISITIKAYVTPLIKPFFIA